MTSLATQRGVGQAQIALAWLLHNPVVTAPLVGALKTTHIDDAIAALDVHLTDDEVARLEEPYTPRLDKQGVSDPAILHRGMEATTGFKVNAA